MILQQAHFSRLCKRTIKYSSLEVAGQLLGDVKNGIINVRKITYGRADSLKRGTFSLRYDPRMSYLSNSNRRSIGAVGIFHTHPCGILFPSLHDLFNMMSTRLPWVILALCDGEVKCEVYVYEKKVIRIIDMRINNKVKMLFQ